MKKTYHKLIRDKIPEIIEAQGQCCIVKKLSYEEYLEMVDAKLDEELAEFHKDQSLEELADLMEVIFAAAEARGYTREQLEQVRLQKVTERGAFRKRLMLLEIWDS